MSNLDGRWQQRFSNYRRALEQLEGFFEPPTLNEREQQGQIKVFETTFELAWNTLRDLLRSQGNADLLGSRDTLREAFRVNLISDGEAAAGCPHSGVACRGPAEVGWGLRR